MARHVLMHVNYKYNVQDLAGHQDFKLDQEINCAIIFIFLARFCECLKHYNSYSNLYVIITLRMYLIRTVSIYMNFLINDQLCAVTLNLLNISD